MSKGVRFRTTIANLTERQRDSGAEGVERGSLAAAKPPQTKAPLEVQGELSQSD